MQYPWKQHYSHPVAIQNERCFPFLDYPCRRSAQKTPNAFAAFPFPAANPESWRTPTTTRSLTSWQSSHQVFTECLILFKLCYYYIVWIVCDMSICNLTDLDCKVFVFWFNWQHDQTSCRLVLLRVLSPKDSWGCRELAQANCEDEGWQFWGLEQFQVVDFNFCVVAAMVFLFLVGKYPSLFKVSTCSFVFPVTRERINRLICLSHFHLFFNSVCSFLLFVSGRPWGHSSLTSLGVLVVPRRNSPCSSLALPRTSWDCQFPTIQNVLKLNQTFSMICYLPF